MWFGMVRRGPLLALRESSESQGAGYFLAGRITHKSCRARQIDLKLRRSRPPTPNTSSNSTNTCLFLGITATQLMGPNSCKASTGSASTSRHPGPWCERLGRQGFMRDTVILPASPACYRHRCSRLHTGRRPCHSWAVAGPAALRATSIVTASAARHRHLHRRSRQPRRLFRLLLLPVSGHPFLLSTLRYFWPLFLCRWSLTRCKLCKFI